MCWSRPALVREYRRAARNNTRLLHTALRRSSIHHITHTGPTHWPHISHTKVQSLCNLAHTDKRKPFPYNIKYEESENQSKVWVKLDLVCSALVGISSEFEGNVFLWITQDWVKTAALYYIVSSFPASVFEKESCQFWSKSWENWKLNFFYQRPHLGHIQ